LTYDEALEIAQAFEKAQVKAFVAYYRRTLPRFVKVKELLDSGAIGEVRFVNVAYYRPPFDDEIAGTHWHIQPDISGGGIFMDMAVHTLDILDFCFGPIAKVKAFCVNQAGIYEPEDNVALAFVFDNQITGTGNWCFTTGVSSDNIKIVGSKGEIHFGCFNNEPIHLKTITEEVSIPVAGIKHVHQNLIQTIVDELNGQGECPSTVASALRTAWVCDQVYQQKN
jgi:predicted dehydrogenase